MAPPKSVQGRVNKFASRLIPLLLIGIAGYATWVVVVLIGVVYLIRPHPGVPARTGAGAATIALYFVFLAPAAAAFFRTFLTVLTDPGYVPYPKSRVRAGSQQKAVANRSALCRGSRPSDSSQVEKNHGNAADEQSPNDQRFAPYLDRGAVVNGRTPPPAGLEAYYSRNLFECQIEGLPRYCPTCRSWKPDRAHHSSEAGRCLYKFDHYCPWAGGTVAEPSFKFFVQFCAYSCVLCTYILILTAYFVAERSSRFGTYDVNWVIILALAALFFMFTMGMCYNVLHAILINSTTIDKLSRRSRIHYLAVWIPPPDGNAPEQQPVRSAESITPYSTITYPLPTETPNGHQSTPPRRFAILASPVGSNPYLLASRMENFKSVMGQHLVDWLLPLRKSPCCSHLHQSDRFGHLMYPLGPVVDQMLMDAGLMPRPSWALANEQRLEPLNQGQRGLAQPNNNDSVSEHTTRVMPTQDSFPSQQNAVAANSSSQTYVPPAGQTTTIQTTPEPHLQGSLTSSRLEGEDGAS